MGNFKAFGLFGYEKWGGLKPAQVKFKGKVYIPLFAGVWIRSFGKWRG